MVEKEEGRKKKILKIVVKVLLIIISLVIFSLLPDLLFKLRFGVKKVPLVRNVVYTEILDKEYIQMMIIALINCIAVSVSIMAYYVAKTTGRAQIEQHEQDIMLAAFNMERNLTKNCQVIFDMKKRVGNAKGIVFSEDLIKNGICLYSAKRITSEERETWQSYVKKVISIVDYYKSGEDNEMNRKIDEYCMKFFKEDAESMEYSPSMQTLMDSLKKISKGE